MGFFDRFKKKKAVELKERKAPKKGAETAEKAAAVAVPAKESGAPAPGAKAAGTARGPLAKETGGQAHRVLMRPVFSEKASRLQAQGKYEFVVSKSANKPAVSTAVRDLYGVEPVSVRVLIRKGKSVRFGRTAGREKDEKLAVVTLKPGESITLIEGA